MTRKELSEKAKPILFNTEMVKAILEGRKTVTRRLPSKKVRDKWYEYKEWVGMVATSLREDEFYEYYTPYEAGDILYVRETWAEPYNTNTGYAYRASCSVDAMQYFKWNASIHMPKEAARIFLKVTDVRVERLQDITDVGAEKEGATPNNPFVFLPDQWPNLENFKIIWNSTIKKADLYKCGWDANPWVWAICFEKINAE